MFFLVSASPPQRWNATSPRLVHIGRRTGTTGNACPRKKCLIGNLKGTERHQINVTFSGQKKLFSKCLELGAWTKCQRYSPLIGEPGTTCSFVIQAPFHSRIHHDQNISKSEFVNSSAWSKTFTIQCWPAPLQRSLSLVRWLQSIINAMAQNAQAHFSRNISSLISEEPEFRTTRLGGSFTEWLRSSRWNSLKHLSRSPNSRRKQQLSHVARGENVMCSKQFEMGSGHQVSAQVCWVQVLCSSCTLCETSRVHGSSCNSNFKIPK